MPSPGLYLVNASGEMTPVLTEDDTGDFQVLEEYLYERGFEIETRDLESFVEERSYVADCDECGLPLSDDETTEFSDGTYCDNCADGREETPIEGNTEGRMDG